MVSLLVEECFWGQHAWMLESPESHRAPRHSGNTLCCRAEENSSGDSLGGLDDQQPTWVKPVVIRALGGSTHAKVWVLKDG